MFNLLAWAVGNNCRILSGIGLVALLLAFPAFITFLVAMIIKLSYHFSIFGRLIGKKDPVATLATLILLSYTKLLQTIITAFSSATLGYPDGSKKSVWLPDATVWYLTSKHAALFTTPFLFFWLVLPILYYFSHGNGFITVQENK